jgi:hypothetical protein
VKTAVRLIWAALMLNVLAFTPLPTLVPIPAAVGQLVTQGSLLAALVLALRANSAGVIRANLLLLLLSATAVLALAVSIHSDFALGSTFRAVRLATFVLVLWLLTPWWGREDLILLRSHLSVLRIVLLSVLAGAVLAPGAAFSFDGRLAGAIWPIPTTQVAHYAAVLFGCTVIGWFCGLVPPRHALITVIGCGAALAATHTRTALAAMLVGLLLAAASLSVGYLRVRRTLLRLGLPLLVAVAGFAPVIGEWASRGQSAEEASQLTGRTKVWSAVAEHRRPTVQEVFGAGLSNKSFDGLAVDNSWVATYLDLGWVGVLLSAALLVILALLVIGHPPGARRAVALFLLIYCLIASVTETGLGDASPYLLELVVAGSLLAAPVRRTGPVSPAVPAVRGRADG